jgi:ankyrin repeat protein
MNNYDLLHNAEKGLYKEVQKQINAGSNPNAVNAEGYSALMLAIRGPIRHRELYRGNKIKTIKILLEKDANINYKNDESSPLFFAIQYGELDIVKLLLTYPEIDKTAALMYSIKELCHFFSYYEWVKPDILDFIKNVDKEISFRENDYARAFDILIELLISGAIEKKSIPELIINYINTIKDNEANDVIIQLHFELLKIIFIYSSVSNVGVLIDCMMQLDYEALKSKSVIVRNQKKIVIRKKDEYNSLRASIQNFHSFYANLYKVYNFKISPKSLEIFKRQEPELSRAFEVPQVILEKFKRLPMDLHNEILAYSEENLIEFIYKNAIVMDADFLKLFGVKNAVEAHEKATNILIRMSNYGVKIPGIDKIKIERQEKEAEKQEKERQAEIRSKQADEEQERLLSNATWGSTNLLATIWKPYNYASETFAKAKNTLRQNTGLGKNKTRKTRKTRKTKQNVLKRK